MTAIVSDRSGLREFFGRLVRCRVGIKWYAVVFAVPVLLCFIAGAITLCFVPRSQISALSIEKIRELPERFVFILFFIGLGEEPGWRGFALPQLQTKHSQLIASLILAPIWAIWHLPLIGNEFPWLVVAPFVLALRRHVHAHLGFQWNERKRVVTDADARNGQYSWCWTNVSTLLRLGAPSSVVDLRLHLVMRRSRRTSLQRE